MIGGAGGTSKKTHGKVLCPPLSGFTHLHCHTATLPHISIPFSTTLEQPGDKPNSPLRHSFLSASSRRDLHSSPPTATISPTNQPPSPTLLSLSSPKPRPSPTTLFLSPSPCPSLTHPNHNTKPTSPPHPPPSFSLTLPNSPQHLH